MKNLVSTLAIVAFLATVSFYSCKKSETKPTTPTIVGNWHLVIDSSYVSGGNIAPVYQTYVGTASDHYNFQPGGKLSYYLNGGGSDSATYTLNSRDTVTIAYLPKSSPDYSQNVVATYIITVLTSNKMVLVLDGGPQVKEFITFSK